MSPYSDQSTHQSGVFSWLRSRVTSQRTTDTFYRPPKHVPRHRTLQARRSILRKRPSRHEDRPIRATALQSEDDEANDLAPPYLGNARRRRHPIAASPHRPRRFQFFSCRRPSTPKTILPQLGPKVPLYPPLTPLDLPVPYITPSRKQTKPHAMQYYPYPYAQYSPYPPTSHTLYPSYGYLSPNGWTSSLPTSTVPLPPTYATYYTPVWHSTPLPQQTHSNSAASHHAALPTVWNTPRPVQVEIPNEGTLTWQPHPHPHPTIPAQQWWTTVIGTPIAIPPPLTPGQALALSGGWPLPGQGPRDFISGDTWPPKARELSIHVAPWLVPNPVDADSFTVRWDIRFPPSSSHHLTGRAFFRGIGNSLNADATYPPTKEMVIFPQKGLAERWGPIVIKQSKNISCMDVLLAIYDYFRKPVSATDMSALAASDPRAYEIMENAMFRRCLDEPGLFEYERTRGMKRVDVMGDTTQFWGMWTTIDRYTNRWHLNLGLVPRRGYH